MDDMDFGYELGGDDIREMYKSSGGSYESDYLFESEECKFILKEMDAVMKFLKGKCDDNDVDETFYSAARTMKKLVEDILNIRDLKKDAADNKLMDCDQKIQEVADVKSEKDAADNKSMDFEQKIEEVTDVKSEKDAADNKSRNCKQKFEEVTDVKSEKDSAENKLMDCEQKVEDSSKEENLPMEKAE